VAEIEEIIIPWLKTSDFEVSRLPLKMKQILFSVSKEETGWKILLKPHSPLATEIWIESESEGLANIEQFEELWEFLNSYGNSILDTPTKRDIADLLILDSAGKGNAEFQEYFSEVVEKIAIRHTQIFLDAVLEATPESKKALARMFEAPLFHSREQIHSSFAGYISIEKYKSVLIDLGVR